MLCTSQARVCACATQAGCALKAPSAPTAPVPAAPAVLARSARPAALPGGQQAPAAAGRRSAPCRMPSAMHMLSPRLGLRRSCMRSRATCATNRHTWVSCDILQQPHGTATGSDAASPPSHRSRSAHPIAAASDPAHQHLLRPAMCTTSRSSGSLNRTSKTSSEWAVQQQTVLTCCAACAATMCRLCRPSCSRCAGVAPRSDRADCVQRSCTGDRCGAAWHPPAPAWPPPAGGPAP